MLTPPWHLIPIYSATVWHFASNVLGKDGRILGPKWSKYMYRTGEVRVKVWKRTDLEPSLDTGFTYSISLAEPFFEVPLQGGVEPDIVVVQARPVDTYPVNSQATGTNRFFSHVVSEALGLPSCFGKCGDNGGGLVFAYNSSTLRLWANSNGKIISTIGWGRTTSAFTSISVQVRILTWHFEIDPHKCLLKFSSQTMFNSTTTLIPPYLDFPHTDLSLVLVKLRAQDGVNEGFNFYGSGSVVLSGTHGGGFVFGYSVVEVVTWFLNPKRSAKHFPVFKIMYPWGNGKWAQTSSYIEIEINVFPFLEKNVPTCGDPLCEEGNSFLVSQNLTYIEYNCRPGYVHHSGDLVKFCNDNNRWQRIVFFAIKTFD